MSSVIVKGMKMPDHCWECWLMRNMTCGACGEMIPVTGKRNHCPLGALPDKHGRLVDADEIPWNYGANGDVVVYPDTIAEMPTIVEAEGDNIEESTYDRGYNK